MKIQPAFCSKKKRGQILALENNCYYKFGSGSLGHWACGLISVLQNVTKKRKTSMTGLTFGSPSCAVLNKNIAEGKTIGSKHAHIKYVYILFCSIVFILGQGSWTLSIMRESSLASLLGTARICSNLHF